MGDVSPAPAMRPSSWYGAAAFILLLAVVVRLPALGPKSWWIDEVITYQVGQLPFYSGDSLVGGHPPYRSQLSFALHDKGPGPLTYLLDGSMGTLAAPMGREGVLRLPSALAGLLLVLWCLAPKVSLFQSQWAMLGAGGLAAVLPSFVGYSTSPRGYAWALLACIAQTTLARELATRSPNGDWKRGVRTWVAYVAAAGGAFLVHPFSILWVAAFHGVLLAKILAPGRREGLRGWGFAAVALALIIFPYGIAWYRNVTGANLISPTAAGFRSLPTLVWSMTASGSLPLILLAGVIAVAAYPTRQDPVRQGRLVVQGAVIAALLAVPTAIVLSLVFAVTARHLFVVDLAALVLLGASLDLLMARNGSRPMVCARVAFAIAACLLAGIAALSWRQSARPYQDWAGVFGYLAGQVRQHDVLLTGPNADIEVAWMYSRAAGLSDSLVPAFVSDEYGQPWNTGTIEGARKVIESGRRIWYVSGFMGVGRTEEYWNLIRTSFREVRIFQGTRDVWLGVHDSTK